MPRKRKQKENEDQRIRETLRSLTESNEQRYAGETEDPNLANNEIPKSGRAADRLDIDNTKRGVTGSDDDGQTR
jgi:hypothetical protein